MIKRSSLSLLGLIGLTLFASPVDAQVVQPSDPSEFDAVFEVPSGGDVQIFLSGVLQGVFGSVQLNIPEGVDLGDSFFAFSGSEVNIVGGSVGDSFDALGGSEVNIISGSVGNAFVAQAGSEVNISGGTVGNFFGALFGSEVNVIGGTIGNFFEANDGSNVTISGGVFGEQFIARAGSVVNINGGTFAQEFLADTGSEVNFSGGVLADFSNAAGTLNISGGTVGENFDANSDSEVNISGGTVGENFDANFNSEVNISGGSLSNFADANSGSEVNISGGLVGFGFDAFPGSVTNISGGSIGRGFNAQLGSVVELIGGEFQLNGAAFSDSTISLETGDVFTGTLADGSAFIFATNADDALADVQLTAAALPALDLSPIVVSTANPNRPSGLRPGQTLRLLSGGELGFNSEVAGATLDVEGGTLGSFFAAANSTVNISDGSVGDFFDALSGSVINISGGTVGRLFTAESGSEVNISGGQIGDDFNALAGSVVNISGGDIGDDFNARLDSVVNISGGTIDGGITALRDSTVNLLGSNFELDGVPVEGFATASTVTIFERNAVLTGLLADGSAFSFDLNLNYALCVGQDSFNPGATLTLTMLGSPFPPFDPNAVPPNDSPITHVPLFNFDGDSQFERFGSSVSNGGDVNGDGFDDVIVGAPRTVDATNGTGSVRVFSGSDGSVIHNLTGGPEIQLLGAGVSGGGDVNGDGFDDIIVGGGDGFEVLFGTTNIPSVQVFSGLDGSLLHDFDNLSGVNVSASDAGDVNGDGFEDIIVGAPAFATANGSFSGTVRVFSGVDGSVLYSIDGNSFADFFGRSVSSAGDVNGDGFADLIVGSDDEFESVQIFSGADGSVLHTFTSSSSNEDFGAAVSDAGDVNGDGFDDIIIGAPLAGNSSGSARVFSGSDGGLLYSFNGASGGDRFGTSVSGVGDVNDDGFDDLIVGAPNDVSGSVRVHSGADGSVLYSFAGDPSLFGISVSGAGDINGDGVADFIVGAARGGANGGGYARVFVSQIAAPDFILGDVDQDGAVTFSDIAPFIETLTSGMFLEQADCNQDGEVNFDDIASFIEILNAS